MQALWWEEMTNDTPNTEGNLECHLFIYLLFLGGGYVGVEEFPLNWCPVNCKRAVTKLPAFQNYQWVGISGTKSPCCPEEDLHDFLHFCRSRQRKWNLKDDFVSYYCLESVMLIIIFLALYRKMYKIIVLCCKKLMPFSPLHWCPF